MQLKHMCSSVKNTTFVLNFLSYFEAIIQPHELFMFQCMVVSQESTCAELNGEQQAD